MLFFVTKLIINYYLYHAVRKQNHTEYGNHNKINDNIIMFKQKSNNVELKQVELQMRACHVPCSVCRYIACVHWI